MAGVAGKNKIETGLRVLYDDTGGTQRDLSSSLVPGSLAINGITFEQVNLTAVSDTIDNYLAGRGSLTITGQFYMDNTATTGSWIVLVAQNGANASTGYTLTIRLGSLGAAPSTGDPELELEAGLFGFPVSNNGGAVIGTATWMPNSAQTVAWGTTT